MGLKWLKIDVFVLTFLFFLRQLMQVLSWLLDGSVNPDVLNRQKQVTWTELNVGFSKKKIWVQLENVCFTNVHCVLIFE